MAWESSLLHTILLLAFLYYAQSQDCVEYFEEADSMFKQPEVVPKKFENSLIVNLTLIERRSYYRCDPPEEKYGVRLDGSEWWVFHGCGGIFEVTECNPDGQPLVIKPTHDAPMTQEAADKKAETKLSIEGKVKSKNNPKKKPSGF